MTWYAWLMVAVVVASALSVVAAIGKPRTPTTPGVAVAVLVIDGLVIWGILALAGAA